MRNYSGIAGGFAPKWVHNHIDSTRNQLKQVAFIVSAGTSAERSFQPLTVLEENGTENIFGAVGYLEFKPLTTYSLFNQNIFYMGCLPYSFFITEQEIWSTNQIRYMRIRIQFREFM